MPTLISPGESIDGFTVGPRLHEGGNGYIFHATADAARDPALDDVQALTRVITRHGGHCGYVGRRSAAVPDGYWAEAFVIDFIGARAAERAAA